VFQFVSIYAAYLYDSVKLYARALDQLLREHKHANDGNLTDEDIERIASNGTRIIETIIKEHTYQSEFDEWLSEVFHLTSASSTNSFQSNHL